MLFAFGNPALLRRFGGGGPAVPITFGALTLIGAGGTPVAVADGVYGSYTVASGTLTPNATPVTPGTYDVGGLTVTSVASEYSVGSEAEYDAAIADVPLTGGRTIRFRAKEYNWGDKVIANGRAFTSEVIITQEPGAQLSNQVRVISSNYITLRGLRLRFQGTAYSDTTTAGIVGFFGPCTNSVIEDCEIIGREHDPMGTLESEDGFRNIYAGIWVSYGVGGAPFGITIRRNLLRSLWEATIINTANAGGIYIHDNEYQGVYADCIRIVPVGDALIAPVHIQRNVFYGFTGAEPDPAPHTDIVQIVSNADNNGLELTDLILRQNIAWMDGQSRGVLIQGLVCFPDGSSNLLKIKDPVVVGNVMALDGSHSCTFSCNGGTFSNNTFLSPSPGWVDVIPGTPASARITLANSSTGNIVVRENVTDLTTLVDGTPTIGYFDNVSLGRKGETIPYSDAFDDAMTLPPTFAAAKAAWNSKTGGPVALASAGAFGSGYGVYGDPRVPAGWSADPAREVGPIAIAPDPFTTGDWGLADNGAGGTLAVTIVTLPFTGWSAITDIEYRVDGGAWVSSAGAVSFEIAGLTNGTAVNVEIRAVNSVGSSAPSDMKAATPTSAGYVINAVEIDGSLGTTAFSGGVAGKRTTLAFRFYVPVTPPSSGTIIRAVAASGVAQLIFSFGGAGAGSANLIFGGLSHNVGAGVILANTWHTVLISVDTTAAARRTQIYVDGTLRVSTSAVADDWEFLAITRMFVSEWAGDLYWADVWWSFTESIDFSDEANRDKFAPTTSKGADGSVPTGVIPALFLSDATSLWHVNKGSGGGLTITGTVTTAPVAAV